MSWQIQIYTDGNWESARRNEQSEPFDYFTEAEARKALKRHFPDTPKDKKRVIELPHCIKEKEPYQLDPYTAGFYPPYG